MLPDVNTDKHSYCISAQLIKDIAIKNVAGRINTPQASNNM